MTVIDKSLISTGKRVIQDEANALQALAARMDESFEKACKLMLSCKGRVVVIGMGKSGHVGNKIAATMASTGTPAFFVHPGEASHGDLGMLTRDDVVLALSYSGETQEMLSLLPAIKRFGVVIISMTGFDKSTLANQSDVHLNVHVEREACSLNLAPTSSTCAQMSMGDALAVALLESRGFSKEDFAFSHPGGSLGRRLLLTVEKVMLDASEAPSVQQGSSLQQALFVMTQSRLGSTSIVDDNHHILGVFTDGDVRRALEKGVDLDCPIEQLMTEGGQVIRPHMLAAEALRIMQTKQINALFVVDEDRRLIGALNMHDLLKAGIV